ncbi:MAG: hypothetical protein KA184_15050 [Candidatus Hydrogenedentes bacterium]|nr:hypothetical protein [Candidatus Hydrogenedentota bacterium]
MEGSIRLHWLDGCVLLLSLALLAGISIYHTRRQQRLKDRFPACRSTRWLPVGASLMAALNSGMDYIMQSAGMTKFGAALASLYAICWSAPQLMNESPPLLLGLFPGAVAEGGRSLSFIWPSSFGLVTTLSLGYCASLLAPGIAEAAHTRNWFAVTGRALEE